MDDELEQIPVSTIETVDDQLITRSMQKLSVWQNLMDSILILWQDLVAKTAAYPLEEHEMSVAKAAVESSKAALTNARTLVEGEDLRRQLCSLDVTVEIRNFTWLRQKILWYNLKIPAPAINDILSTSRR